MQTEVRTKEGGLVQENRRSSSPWILPLAALAVLVLITGALYRYNVAAAVRVWWYHPTYSHCFLIAPISAWLIFRQRHNLFSLAPHTYPAALLAVLPLIAASLVGVLTTINEIQQFALVGYIQVLILTILGPQIYRRILFPCLYLFFLVPSGEYLIPPLQHITTQFVSTGLSLLSVPHYTEGNTIELVNGRYEVAEACAGLRFLISTIAVGVLFVHFTYTRLYKIFSFLLACVIVPIIGNGFRALGIVLLANWSNNRIAMGADHLVYGWGFSVLILFALMFGGSYFADPMPDEVPTGQAMPARVRSVALLVTMIAALFAVSVAPAASYWYAHRPIHFNAAVLAEPPLPAGWRAEAMLDDWTPDFAGQDRKLAFSLRDPTPFSPPVDVFVFYYAASREGHELVTSTNKMWNETLWHPVRGGAVRTVLGGAPIKFQETEIASPLETRLIWWTYWSDRRFTTSGVQVKLDKLKNAFSDSRGSALFVVSTAVSDDVDVARSRLARAIGTLNTVPAMLSSAGDISLVKQGR